MDQNLERAASGTSNVHYIFNQADRTSAAAVRSSLENDITRKFNELCTLAPGWDGYRSPPVRFDTANFAYGLIQKFASIADLPPKIVPTSSGAVQAEWDFEGGIAELLFYGPLRASAYLEFEGEAEEFEFGNDFRSIETWITDKIVRRTVDRSAAG